MTHFYYDDPLAAAWMAKHFGMSLYIGDLEANDFDSYSDSNWWQVTEDVRYKQKLKCPNTKVLIHPASLHLLQPLKGDLVFYGYGFFQHSGEVWDEVKGVISHNDEGYPYTGNGEDYVICDSGESFGIGRLKRIIQRNDLAFHWPKEEA